MRRKGFSLIEILVVLLIVGITMSFAMMAFGDFGEKRRIIIAAEQFTHVVKLVQQQAILETSTLGIGFNNNSYHVLRLSTSNRWTPIQKKSIFHRQQFPKGLVISLRNASVKHGIPPIVINSSGDMTAFTLDFGTTKQATMTTISGLHNGALTIQTEKSP